MHRDLESIGSIENSHARLSGRHREINQNSRNVLNRMSFLSSFTRLACGIDVKWCAVLRLQGPPYFEKSHCRASVQAKKHMSFE